MAEPDQVTKRLLMAWRRGPSAQQASELVRTVPVPGSVALRGRFMFLTDPDMPPMDAALFAIDDQVWSEQIRLTTAADRALIENRVADAVSALLELKAISAPLLHQLPVVDALVGLGDAARQSDQLEDAIAALDEALVVAEQQHYRFGTVRALVSLGYVTMQVRTLAEAADCFERAALICRELDERVYLAGALTGLGETYSRLRLHTQAIRSLEEALAICDSIQSHGGVVNAAQHLGDLHRRQRQFALARDAFLRALQTAEQHGPWIGVVNAADGLGEASIGLRELDAAVRYYGRAYEMSDRQGYVRGQAHSLNGLGRCAYMEGDWATATDFHTEALERYGSLGDLPSATNALDGLARAAEGAEDWPAAVQHRLKAIAAIEEMRSIQDRHDYQQEYRTRFEAVYSWGMRTALAAADVAAFVAVFEGIAGRRLAGLIESIPSPELIGGAQLVANMTARSHALPGTGTDLGVRSRAERLTRLLGRHALRGALPEMARQTVDDLTAALYRPFDAESAVPLIKRVVARTDVLLVCEIPGGGGEIAWVRSRNGGNAIHIGRLSPNEAQVGVIRALASSGLPADATSTYLSPLGDLLPPEAFHTTDGDEAQLVVVPLGDLWAIPWPAIELDDGTVVGERFAVAVTPSLTVADHVTGQPSPAPRTVGYWRSPLIVNHEIQAFDGDQRVDVQPLPSAIVALAGITRATLDLVVIAGHGRPVEGIGHYLELDEQVFLEPTALLNADAPRQLVLISCWGARAPGTAAADPLTLATLALARGTHQVLATVSELADDRTATRFVNNILHRLPEQTLAVALRDETRRFLASDANRRGPLSRWAPLVTVGGI